MAVNTPDKNLCPHGAHILMGGGAESEQTVSKFYSVLGSKSFRVGVEQDKGAGECQEEAGRHFCVSYQGGLRERIGYQPGPEKAERGFAVRMSRERLFWREGNHQCKGPEARSRSRGS